MVVPSVFVEAKPDYLYPKIKAPTPLFRYDSNVSGHADRFYFKFDKTGKKAKSFISLTALINHTLPKGFGYYKWLTAQGERAEEIREDRAVFGSALHGEALSPLIQNGGYDYDWLKQKAKYTRIDKDGQEKVYESRWTNYQMLFPVEYREKSASWYYAFTRSLMSFFQFAQERIVQVLAVEIPLCAPKWGYAGTLDLVCLLRWNRKIVFAIIDLKSFFFTLFSDKESKVLYDSHALQLELQLELYRTNFAKGTGSKAVLYSDPEYGTFTYGDAMLFNWSPKNWRGFSKKKDGSRELVAPTYDLTDQSDNKFRQLIKIKGVSVTGWELHLYQSKLHDLPTPPTTTIDIKGFFDHWSKFNYEDHLEEIEL